MMTGKRKLVWWGLILVLMGAVLLMLPVVRGMKAAGLTINLLVPEGEWRPLEWSTEKPVRERVEGVAGREGLVMDVYYPRQTRGGMVIYTPLIGGGLRDARLVNLAESFARLGYVVAVPGREQQVKTIRLADTDDVAAAMGWLKDQERVKDIGLFGISYGNGPVFAVAADEEWQSQVAWVVSLNGLADLGRVIDFLAGGKYAYGDIIGQRQPHPYPREILFNTREELGLSAEMFETSEVWRRMREEFSPVQRAGDVRAPVILIHSTDDNFVPYTESLYLRDALEAEGVDVTLVLTDVLQHGELKPVTGGNLIKVYGPAVYSFYRAAVKITP